MYEYSNMYGHGYGLKVNGVVVCRGCYGYILEIKKLLENARYMGISVLTVQGNEVKTDRESCETIAIKEYEV